MDPKQLKSAFLAVVDAPEIEREVIIRQMCMNDPSGELRLRKLLASHVSPNIELDAPLFDTSVRTLFHKACNQLEWSKGAVIDKYQLKGEIGRGGMAVVYEAGRVDGEYEQRVAIKVIANGRDNDFINRRLRRERQILANLNHPNIAKLLDGGTVEGSYPYLVMEYVDGLPLDRFLESRGPSVEDRLELFCTIGEAVAYAHRMRVVHRDLKPSNILVDDRGVPKLLDFGIAKLHEPLTIQNGKTTDVLVMTPEYASPEQMSGTRLTFKTDQYSLGVLLYEMLTNRRPYDFKTGSPADVVHAICEQEPPAPSVVLSNRGTAEKSRFARQLDHIVLKALRKDPNERYESVDELVTDIRRALAGSSIVARRTASQWLGKRLAPVGRSRIAALTLLVSALIAGLGLTVWNTQGSNADHDRAGMQEQFKMLGGTRDPEAEALFLKGQNLWSQRSIESTRESIETFQAALQRDPSFALAHAELAKSYGLYSIWTGQPKLFELARTAALRSVELEPKLPQGHLSLAMVYWLYDWEWDAADREFVQAISLDPNYARAPHWYGLYLAEMGRADEALAAEDHALELEPLSVPINADRGRVLYYARRYAEAAKQYRKTMDLNPNYAGCAGEQYELYEAAGMTKEWGDHTRKLGFMTPKLARVLRSRGIPAAWEELTRVGGWSYYFSATHLKNHPTQAFAYIEQGVQNRNQWIAQLKINPLFDPLRTDPRFIRILSRLRLD